MSTKEATAMAMIMVVTAMAVIMVMTAMAVVVVMTAVAVVVVMTAVAVVVVVTVIAGHHANNKSVLEPIACLSACADEDERRHRIRNTGEMRTLLKLVEMKLVENCAGRIGPAAASADWTVRPPLAPMQRAHATPNFKSRRCWCVGNLGASNSP